MEGIGFSPFIPDWLQYHISVHKFLLIVIALEMWSFTSKNLTIVVLELHLDNLAVVQIINKKNIKGSKTNAINETFNTSVPYT